MEPIASGGMTPAPPADYGTHADGEDEKEGADEFANVLVHGVLVQQAGRVLTPIQARPELLEVIVLP